MIEVVRAIRRANRVAVVSHRDPDPDTIGAALALGLGLERAGATVSFHCADPLPDGTEFLAGSERIRPEPPPAAADLVVIVDFNDPTRANLPFPAGVPVAVVDHHATDAAFGDARWIDATSAATCEMVGRLIDALEIPWTPAMATAALCGLMTDTGSFQFPSTDRRAYERGGMLRDAGADLQSITYNVFRNKRFEMLKLRGMALRRMVREDGGRLVWSELRRGDYGEAGATDADTTGLAEQLAQSTGVRVALLFQEQPDAVRVSCRTLEWAPAVNAAALMQRFGGGGHLRAAGALVPGRLDEVRERVLAAARETLAAGAASTAP